MEVEGRIDSLPVICPELDLVFSCAPGVFLIFDSGKVLAVRKVGDDQAQTAEIPNPTEVLRRSPSDMSYEAVNPSPVMPVEQLVWSVTVHHPFGVLVRAEIGASKDNNKMMIIWSRLGGLHPDFLRKIREQGYPY